LIGERSDDGLARLRFLSKIIAHPQGGITGDILPSVITAALLSRLGNLPFWRGTESVLKVLTPAYTEATQRGCDCSLCLSTQAEGVSDDEI